jgi:hypothetical protein
VQLGSGSRPSEQHFEGRVEEVDSGKELRFHSLPELLGFLGARFHAVLVRKADILEMSNSDDGNARK